MKNKALKVETSALNASLMAVPADFRSRFSPSDPPGRTGLNSVNLLNNVR